MTPLKKYLSRYAEPETAARADRIRDRYDGVLVIPVHDEPAPELGAITSSRFAENILHIVVVNARADQRAAQQANARLIARLARITGIPLVAVDRSTPPHSLPPKQGVGLARKIGCDLALELWARGQIASPWIHSTDADVLLPTDIFARARAVDPSAVALTYPFRHESPGGGPPSPALAIYELSLHHYVEGLRHASSPYAYQCLGSTLAIRADIYAAVRGFPKREAGEDFYLMNKTRKLGPVVEPAGAPIRIVERPSLRVPFGTGRKTAEFAALLARGDHPCFYDPHLFDHLRDKVAEIDRLRDNPVEHRRAHEWFDARRTLKFLHALRDERYPSLPWREALARAPWSSRGSRYDFKNVFSS